MGMDLQVAFGDRPTPAWPRVRDLLARLGLTLPLRMIDGQLAFPDEEPAESWRELRVATPYGMLTLRRSADGVAVVAWGNADANLRQDWNALAWAFAEAGGGTIQTVGGALDAATFRRTAELAPAIRAGT